MGTAMEKLTASKASATEQESEASLEECIQSLLSGREGNQYLGGQVEQPHPDPGEGEQPAVPGHGKKGGEVLQPHAEITADEEDAR